MVKYGVESHCYNIKAAADYGIAEAVILFHLRYWIDKNKKNKRNYKEGRTWTYNSITAFQGQFPEMNNDQIKRLLNNLVEKGVIQKTNKFNKWKNDRTNWYGFVNEADWFEQVELEGQQEEPVFDEDSLFGEAKTPDQSFNDDKIDQNSGENEVIEAVGKVGGTKLPDQIVGEANPPYQNENEKVGGAKTHNDIVRNYTIDSAESHQHYQINNQISTNEEEEDKSAVVVNPFEMLLNKKPLEAFLDGTADKLAFDFNDTDLVNAKITQLFRVFVRDVQPQEIHMAWIRKELMEDLRQELTRKVCWVIILIAFMEYPGTEKKYQNVNSLMKRIGWKKDDYVQEFYAHEKRIENMKTRAVSKAAEKEENEKNIELMLTEAREKLERYKHKLSLRQITEITELISRRNFLQVNSKLIEFIEEEAA